MKVRIYKNGNSYVGIITSSEHGFDLRVPGLSISIMATNISQLSMEACRAGIDSINGKDVGDV